MQKIFLPLLVIALLITACGSNPGEPTSAPTPTETNAFSITPTVAPTSTATPSLTPVWSWTGLAADFNDLAILSNNEVWITSFSGMVAHQCGGAGNDCTSPTATYKVDCAVKAIDFTSYSDGWLLACSNIYHWDNDPKNFEWKLQRPKDAGDVRLEDIGFADSNSGWVVGYKSGLQNETVILHWNGVEWQNISLLDQVGRNNFSLIALDVISENDVWAVGDAVLHWNGGQWREIPLPPNWNSIVSVSANSETDVWVAGHGLVLHWNGDNWATIKLDSFVGSVLAISPDNVWAGGGGLYHWDGREWQNTQYVGGGANDIIKMILAPDGNVWALTTSGNMYLLGK